MFRSLMIAAALVVATMFCSNAAFAQTPQEKLEEFAAQAASALESQAAEPTQAAAEPTPTAKPTPTPAATSAEAQEPELYETDTEELRNQLKAALKAQATAKTEAAKAAEAVKAMNAKFANDNAYLEGLKNAKVNLEKAEVEAAPGSLKQVAVNKAYKALQAAQEATKEKPTPENDQKEFAAAETYRQAGNAFDQARNAPIQLRVNLVKNYALDDAGITMKIEETEKGLVELRKQLMIAEASLAEKANVAASLREETTLAEMRCRLEDHKTLTEVNGKRLEGIEQTTSNTAVAVERGFVSVDKQLNSLFEQNKKLLEDLAPTKATTEKAQKQLEEFKTAWRST